MPVGASEEAAASIGREFRRPLGYLLVGFRLTSSPWQALRHISESSPKMRRNDPRFAPIVINEI